MRFDDNSKNRFARRLPWEEENTRVHQDVESETLIMFTSRCNSAGWNLSLYTLIEIMKFSCITTRNWNPSPDHLEDNWVMMVFLCAAGTLITLSLDWWKRLVACLVSRLVRPKVKKRKRKEKVPFLNDTVRHWKQQNQWPQSQTAQQFGAIFWTLLFNNAPNIFSSWTIERHIYYFTVVPCCHVLYLKGHK